MTQKVKGFLASDGKFFETEAECSRYEYQQMLIELCDSHNINPENFFQLLREWSVPIKAFYHADSQCKESVAQPKGAVEFDGAEDVSYDTRVPSPDDDYPDPPVRDKDAPGFLEQQVRGRK